MNYAYMGKTVFDIEDPKELYHYIMSTCKNAKRMTYERGILCIEGIARDGQKVTVKVFGDGKLAAAYPVINFPLPDEGQE